MVVLSLAKKLLKTTKIVLMRVTKSPGWDTGHVMSTANVLGGWLSRLSNLKMGHLTHQPRSLDIAFFSRFWRQGYAKEASRGLLRYGFATLGLKTVVAQTMAVNEASRATMRACGLQHVRTFYMEFDNPIPGTEEGEVEYKITKEEWPLQISQREKQSEMHNSMDVQPSSDLSPAGEFPSLAEEHKSTLQESSTCMMPEDYQPEPRAFTLYQKEEGGKISHWIKFAGDDNFIPDRESRPRGPFTRVIKWEEKLSTEVMDPIMKAQREVYEAIFRPTELVYVLAAGIPPFGSGDRLAEKKGFEPQTHQIIVRMIHSGSDDNTHWTLLMHFIQIETVLVWDSMNRSTSDATAAVTTEPSDMDHFTILQHAEWTHGTVAEAKHSKGEHWEREEFLGHGTQTDWWSCGLWCLARLEDLYRTLNERIAIDMELDYRKVVETLIKSYGNKSVEDVDLERANSRLQLAYSLGFEIKP